eukprot:gnl/TRDRNA2_/TRDRNA2_125188_c0_seq5.p2 gnl/TRDRNA2_/TRDRNA2_125188_c0~~gnl/TRDRNA2_/TRDRNA2_125188_c0_seq5.p2  ORF type:complete len:129 (+),score=5.33 gnl/TRDRNA2_/TRDRNA2_125188_c0_seq5:18-404(+)
MHLERILSNGTKPFAAAFPTVASHPLLTHPRLRAGRGPVPCSTNGCPASFCNVACRDRALERGPHRVLCAELDEVRRRHWTAFRAHARRSRHDNFLLAAFAYARATVVCTAKYSFDCAVSALDFPTWS